MIKLIAFDLDGTLTQHKTPLEPANFEALQALSKKYKLSRECLRIRRSESADGPAPRQ